LANPALAEPTVAVSVCLAGKQDWTKGGLVGLQQAFVQQAAMAEMMAQAPVACESGRYAWLVHEVDVVRGNQTISLTFKTTDGVGRNNFFTLALQANSLRQWLNILHGQCRKAEWTMPVWPDWMASTQAAIPMSLLGMLH
jgi:hypothetical protein